MEFLAEMFLCTKCNCSIPTYHMQLMCLTSTHNMSFVLGQKLIIDPHLYQYLDGCLTYCISTVLITWKLLLLQEEDFSTECGQVVGQS